MTFNENEIVERFVQGDKSRNSHGSGLGLAIVKSFTEIQGGQFHVELDGDLFKTVITFLQSIGTYYLGYKFLRLIYRLELWFNLLSGRIADWIFYIPIIKLIKLKVLTAFCGSDGLFGLN